MEIRIETKAAGQLEADWLVATLCEEEEFSPAVGDLDDALDGQLTRLKEREDLTGKAGEIVVLPDVQGIAANRLLLAGLGKRSALSVDQLNKTLSTAARRVSEKPAANVAVLWPEIASDLISAEQIAQTLASAFAVGCAGQGLFKKEPARYPIETLTVSAGGAVDSGAIGEDLETGRILGEAINLTRELVNRPAQEIYPETFANRAQEAAREYGLRCEVLSEADLQGEKMGSMLAVAQGSDRPPRLVILEHKGAGEGAPALALVGKGVTFDSGGLSLKPTDGMKTMKCDMAGAATVLGAMTAIARLKLPVNVVGYMGMVENMVSGKSYKLGDVLTARNGTTIEVLNTDAEGRLVLADVLSLAADRGAERIIDLATLTGSCVVALGEEVTGVFTNDQGWCDQVLRAAETCSEPVWQLPMFESFAEQLKSDVADCKNVGTRWGGAVTAAKFLEKFVAAKPWVHLDIAGPAFASNGNNHREGGATGCMVKTLVAVAGGRR